MCGLDACLVNKSNIRTLDYVISGLEPTASIQFNVMVGRPHLSATCRTSAMHLHGPLLIYGPRNYGGGLV